MKKLFVVLPIIALLGIQFFRPEKNQNPHLSEQDLFEKHHAPDEVRQLVNGACYDCHSNNTRYPWYANIQPVNWWLNYHVNEAKRSLNFSEFGTYSPKRAARKMEQASEELDDGTMPLKTYRWMHPEARLTAAQKTLLEEWFEATGEQLQSNKAEPEKKALLEAEP